MAKFRKLQGGGSLLNFGVYQPVNVPKPLAETGAMLEQFGRQRDQIVNTTDAIDVALANKEVNPKDASILEQAKLNLKQGVSEIATSDNLNLASAKARKLYKDTIGTNVALIRAEKDQQQNIKNKELLDTLYGSGKIGREFYTAGLEKGYTSIAERTDPKTGFITPLAQIDLPTRYADVDKKVIELARQYNPSQTDKGGETPLFTSDATPEQVRLGLSNYIQQSKKTNVDYTGLEDYIAEKLLTKGTDEEAYITSLANLTGQTRENVARAYVNGMDKAASFNNTSEYIKYTGDQSQYYRQLAIKDKELEEERITKGIIIPMSNEFSKISKQLNKQLGVKVEGTIGRSTIAPTIGDTKLKSKPIDAYNNLDDEDTKTLVSNIAETQFGINKEQLNTLSIDERNKIMTKISTFMDKVSDKQYISSYNKVFNAKQAKAETEVIFDAETIKQDGLLTGSGRYQNYYDPETGKYYSGSSDEFNEDIISNLSKGDPVRVVGKLEPINPFVDITKDTNFVRGYIVQLGNKTLIMGGYDTEISEQDVSMNQIYMSSMIPGTSKEISHRYQYHDKDNKIVSERVPIKVSYTPNDKNPQLGLYTATWKVNGMPFTRSSEDEETLYNLISNPISDGSK